MKKISREEAKETNQPWFFTGEVCANGHVERRYVSTGICYACKREQNNRDYKEHTERVLAGCHKSYQANKQTKLAGSKRWAETNREKSNAIKQAYKKRHRKKYLAYCRDYVKRKRKDPFFRLSRNMSKALWEFLSGGKGYRHWEQILGYTKEQLVTHLESQFVAGVTWDNYGSYWHVDHKIPLEYFLRQPLTLDEKVKQAWALSNLQPLAAKENLSKGSRLLSEFIADNNRYEH